jgi:glutamyl-tRNA(Gln) amidotransferase subunit E
MMNSDKMAHDYKKLGFMCGLEIHQRLATKEKLFCSCSASLSEDRKTLSIMRRQRAVAGELGQIDRSTAFESRKGRHFTYNLFKSSSCLVDSDEEPPHALNQEALEAAIIISESLNARIPDEIEVMRKGVVDGSDPGAFQRTMLIGFNGYIELSGKKVPVPSIFLEEESGGIVSSNPDSVEYNLDRFAIPLIEIDTDPVIESPSHAKEVAMRIGLLLRLTGMAQRGIGSIRQDVNVSIKSGARVEIKGFQDLDIMDTIIENEVTRQVSLVKARDTLRSRGAKAGKATDVTHLFKSTTAKILSAQLADGGVVIGIRLHGFKGVVGMEIAPGMRLGTEISDYAKMAGVRGIIHSDEDMNTYGITEKELLQLSKALELGDEDAFVLVAEKSDKAERAAQLAIERADKAVEGVPSETRAVDQKRLCTRFMRPVPGGSRMYPETDVLPVLAGHLVKKAQSKKVDIDAARKALHEQIGNTQLAEQMLWSRELPLYRAVISETKASPAVAASVLLEKFRELSRAGVRIERIPPDTIIEIFSLYSKGRITKAGIGEILSEEPKDGAAVEIIIEEKKLQRISGKKLQELISSFDKTDKPSLMREIMLKHKYNVEGDELSRLIK